jgi:hypothetical protein
MGSQAHVELPLHDCPMQIPLDAELKFHEHACETHLKQDSFLETQFASQTLRMYSNTASVIKHKQSSDGYTSQPQPC